MTNEEELLKEYIKKLEEAAIERLHERDVSPMQALKEALTFIEGEMQGY